MNYEEKYNKALERAKKIYPNVSGQYKADLEYVYPELKKESEDEKIRKALLEYFGEQCDMSNWNGVYGYEVYAWLEKQGKESSWKPTKEQYEALDYAYNNCSDTERGNYYEGVLETLIEDLHRLEKQGDKVEPKFKVGD